MVPSVSATYTLWAINFNCTHIFYTKEVFLSFFVIILGLIISEKVFVSQERVSSLPEKGADLQGSPGNFRGSPGTSGEVW